MRKSTFLLSLLLSAFASRAQSVQLIGTTAVEIDTLVQSLYFPWEMQLEKNTNYMWLTERHGVVSRINLATKQKTMVLNITSLVELGGEAGLLGLQLHPSFPAVPEVFMVYTYGPKDANDFFFEKLVKYTWNGAQLVNPQDLITGIPAYLLHNGSRLLFLPDGTLLMSTGERHDDHMAQDPNSLLGKYLRLNPDGTIPADNPDPSSYVYTLGHRNSQGLVQLPSGKLIISEHGPSNDDELSVLEPSKNYGWPLIEGFCDQSTETAACATGSYTEPIHAWSPTLAVSDLVYYQNPAFPEWNNRLLMATLKNASIRALQLNATEDQVIDEDTYLQGQFGRMRDVMIGPNKEIYICTSIHVDGFVNRIIRIKPVGTVGIESLSEVSFRMYPNPVTDVLYISQPLSTVDVVVTDLSGREVYRMRLEGTEGTLDMSMLKPGFYDASLQKNGQVLGHHKIIKL